MYPALTAVPRRRISGPEARRARMESQMNRRLLSTFVLVACSTLAFFVALRPPSRRSGPALPYAAKSSHAKIRLAGKLSQVPLAFEPTVGEPDSASQFLSRNKNYTLFLTPAEAVFSFRSAGNGTQTSRDAAQPSAIQMKFVNANSDARIFGQEESGAVSNYFIGKDPRNWRTNVPSYRSIREHNLYDGIDLLYYGKDNELEHDLVVAPGKNPNVIAITFPEATSVKTNGAGDLIVRTAQGELRLQKPRIYQQRGVNPVEVEGGYVLQSANQIGFRVGKYNQSEPLVIDPVLEFSTYLGGNDDESVGGVAVDTSGNIYVVGGTASANFPLQNPLNPNPNPNVCGTAPNTFHCSIGFITKFDPTGTSLVYSTYFGGTGANEGAGSPAVDASGNLYVAGITSSSDFPTTAGAFSTTFDGGSCTSLGYVCYEAYVAKFNASGSTLIYSTYLGGIGGDSFVQAPRGLAVDGLGRVYVTGSTVSSSFPTTTGAFQTKCALNTLGTACAAQKAFVSVLNPAGSALVYSTYLGGSGTDQGKAIAVDSAGSAVITGWTFSTDFPLANPMQAQPAGAFFTKLTPDGSGLLYSSYFGTINPPNFYIQTLPDTIALDVGGNVYIGGSESSGSAGYTAFLSKIDKSGGALVYSANLTGASTSPFTEIFDVAVNSLGQAYVTGDTNVTGLTQVNSPLPNYAGGKCTNPGQYSCTHGFVAEFNASGNSLLFSTYLGGSNVDAGVALAIDTSQSIYVVGQTNSSDFPVANAYQRNYGGGTCLGAPCFDAFLAKIQPPSISPSPTALAFPPQLVGVPSAPQTVTITNSNTQPVQILSLVASTNFSETDACSGNIPGGSTCIVNASFIPTVTGPISGNLTINFGGSGGTTVVALTGSGIQPTAPVISPSSLQFNPQAIGNPSTAQVITVTAQGTGPLNIASIATSSDFPQTNNCVGSVSPGSTCSISVVFTPQAPGARNGQITINDNATNTPQIVSLTGMGTGPFALLSATSLQFSPQAFDTISAGQPVTVTNTGNSVLNISSIIASPDFGETDNCGATIAPTASCSISVTFSPTGLGGRSGSIQVTDNAFGSPQGTQLTGKGVFSIGPSSGSSGSATVTAGQTATYQLGLGPQNFSGSVALTYSPVTVVPSATCSVAPNPVVLNGTTAPLVTVLVTTMARSGTSLPFPTRRFYGPSAYQLPSSRWLFYLLLSLALVWASRKFRRIPLTLSMALLLVVLVSGCSSGGSGTQPGGGGSTGTPAGTYQLVVTASSSGISNSTKLTLIVQ
jgi:hypothetical protein